MSTPESMTAILRAHLNSQGLVLCRASDTQYPLDGMCEAESLREIAAVAIDAMNAAPADDGIELFDVREWDDTPTAPIPDLALAIARTRSASYHPNTLERT